MLQSLKWMYGDKLGASDGEIGHVKDFYFDDQNWAVRYVVADTGSWLPGRQVLISPHAFGSLHQAGKVLLVNLTRKQIEDSPSIESHKPVSRQYEEEYYRYYGWPYYWQGDGLWGMSGFPILELPAKPLPSEPATPATRTARARRCSSAEHASRERLPPPGERWDDRPRLRFYDGRPELGDSVNWSSKPAIGFPAKRCRYRRARWTGSVIEESTVFVNLTKEAVEQSPAHPLAPVGAVD